MRILLYMWAVPMALFWGWYGLSAHDWNFGTLLLSRRVHDLVFEIYGKMLGAAPETVPAMIAGASALDTAIVMSILAWGWRASWVPQTAARVEIIAAAIRRRYESGLPVASITVSPAGPAHPAE